MRTALTSVTVALVLAAGATTGTSPVTAGPGAGQRSPGSLVSARDHTGDVWLNPRVHGIPPKQKRSIDLSKVTIERRGSVIRFQVRIRKLLFGQRWDQMAFFVMTPADGSTDWQGDVGMSPQKPRAGYGSLYYAAGGGTYVTCDPLRSRSRATERTFWVDVPMRCVPKEPAHIKVYTYAGIYRGDGNAISKDHYRVPGRHTLR